MSPDEFRRAFKLLFENFWIIRKQQPEDYAFLRRNQLAIQKELRQRFGMNLIVRPQYIQLLKRPQVLEEWMGAIGFQATLDYTLFCCAMAYVEDLEEGTPFMLNELVRDLGLLIPEELSIDWQNYNHRKSLVRVLKKMLELSLVETIQGDTDGFSHSEANQEVLFQTTQQTRAFLARAPQSYTQYEDFDTFWSEFQSSQNLEENQLLYQRLMFEPAIQRTVENEEVFNRLRNYYHWMEEYIENNTEFRFELYRDYAALTLEYRESFKEVFPSRRVIDDVLIQLATLIRKAELEPSSYGVLTISHVKWSHLLLDLQGSYQEYWSKEYNEMSLSQLGDVLLERASDWGLLEVQGQQIAILPSMSRLIAEMEKLNETVDR